MNHHELTPEDLFDEHNDEDTDDFSEYDHSGEGDSNSIDHEEEYKQEAEDYFATEEESGVADLRDESDDSDLLNEGLCYDFSSFEIDPTASIDEPPVCLSVYQDGRLLPLATLGNISLITGKPKSMKTFLVAAIAAAAISDKLKMNWIEGSLPKEKNHVIVVDTEQSKYHATKSANRMLRLAGDSFSDRLKVYSLRKLTPKDRLKWVARMIDSDPKLGLIIIDGLRDLVTSINEEEQSTNVTNKLLQWSDEKNIHIIVILHYNKSDSNVRGTLGTELINKAEIVLSATKGVFNGRTISIVNADFCREIEPIPFAFGIDDSELPEKIEGWEKGNDSRLSLTKAQELERIPDSTILTILESLFKQQSTLKFRELRSQLQTALNGYGHSFGDALIGALINRCKEKGLIKHQGRDGTKNSVYLLGKKPGEIGNTPYIPLIGTEDLPLISTPIDPDDQF